eukprot:c9073_g1_i2.p1 GENE.c9073_g1_i2~~c9073_g1_i2.p1  ORF type:complete len:149 (+),score=16.19 c9073_g1_i2:62-508(+)
MSLFSKNGIAAITLLFFSCCLMVTAWYLHLHFHDLNMAEAIFMSWAIALGEYVLMVPANRIGHEVLSAAQLRAIAELWIIAAFLIFNRYVLNEPVLWNHLVGFAGVIFGVWVVLLGPFPQTVFQTDESRAKLLTQPEVHEDKKSYQGV